MSTLRRGEVPRGAGNENLTIRERVVAWIADHPIKAGTWFFAILLLPLMPLFGLNLLIEKQAKACDWLWRPIAKIAGCPESRSSPIVVRPALEPAPSKAEIERDIERARRETLEKALKDVASARPAPPPPISPVAIEPSPKAAVVPKAIAPDRTAALPPAPPKPCIQIGGRIDRPITVTIGAQLCAKADGIRATVHDITSNALVYSVPGWQRVTCQRSEPCTFNWDGAPVFNVDVIDGTNGRQAVLVNAR